MLSVSVEIGRTDTFNTDRRAAVEGLNQEDAAPAVPPILRAMIVDDSKAFALRLQKLLRAVVASSPQGEHLECVTLTDPHVSLERLRRQRFSLVLLSTTCSTTRR